MSRITSSIMMVRPANFGYNHETAQNNAFQSEDLASTAQEIREKALMEFDLMVTKLRQTGIEVLVFKDTPIPIKPDAIFPNNWISFHEDGSVITYPMWSNIRRKERREDIITALGSTFKVKAYLHLEHEEQKEKYLEGTGSMVFDREARIAYACVSPRTHPDLFFEFCERFGYTPILFEAVDSQQQLIYHTNVMMAIGESTAVVCLESIAGSKDRTRVVETLDQKGLRIVEISQAQMQAFAGNMLQLQAKTGIKYIVMSEQAYLALDSNQIRALEKDATCFYLPIYTIEKSGGGSVRCMMAEIFLPRLSA